MRGGLCVCVRGREVCVCEGDEVCVCEWWWGVGGWEGVGVLHVCV